MNVLVLAPHTDDGELGCGATLARLIEEGARVHYLVFSTGNPETGATPAEFYRAVTTLGIDLEDTYRYNLPCRHFPEHRQEILDIIVRCRVQIVPDLVFCPHSQDVHQDHQVVYQEAVRAIRYSTLLGYILPTANRYRTDCFWEVQERHLATKVRAVACYKSQANRGYTRWKAIWSQAVLRGLQGGLPYAEAFEVLCWVV